MRSGLRPFHRNGSSPAAVAASTKKIMDFEQNTHSLAARIPSEEWRRVLDSDASAEIDGCCLTCLDYTPLAYLIPKHWTVIDFGCSYNAQAYLFEHHRRLISVDLSMNVYEPDFHLERFKPPWCELYEMSIKEWLDAGYAKSLDLSTTFAICGYVPSKEVALVRDTFRNLFVYYPAGDRAAYERERLERRKLVRLAG